MNIRESFKAGYEKTMSHEITGDMTNREIEERYPTVDVMAFRNGIEDALNNDSWRYDRGECK